VLIYLPMASFVVVLGIFFRIIDPTVTWSRAFSDFTPSISIKLMQAATMLWFEKKLRAIPWATLHDCFILQ